ncbi:MAG: thioredoxin reductase [Deltaproteobacteria bacterium SG8_13]|nr:MAG: thioredoxin reductase [Deltaproteobacteria bacterium SG8_13]
MTEAQYDVVILGTGPAGLQAAIHAARRKVSVLILGKSAKSSLFRAHVENFCCIFDLSGEEMLRIGREQAIGFGARMLEEDVMQVSQDGDLFVFKTESGQQIRSKSLIIATGAARKRLGVPGETELLGRGVSYCVDCDANFFRNQEVVVVGNESAAVGGALDLLDYAQTVHLVAKQLQVVDHLKQALEASQVVLHEGVETEAIKGDDEVTGLLLKDGTLIPASGVFIELGARGILELATPLGILLDAEAKYIEANKKQETNVPGIYAAGDICGPPWQMAKAVGEGCVAGLEAAAYAKKLKSVSAGS